MCKAWFGVPILGMGQAADEMLHATAAFSREPLRLKARQYLHRGGTSLAAAIMISLARSQSDFALNEDIAGNSNRDYLSNRLVSENKFGLSIRYPAGLKKNRPPSAVISGEIHVHTRSLYLIAATESLFEYNL